MGPGQSSLAPAHPVARIVAGAAIGIALAVLLARTAYYSRWMDDDAFISYRYARNLVHGTGLVYNVGERVEGYSNFLWTILLAAAYRLGAPLPEAARVLGTAFAIATGVLLLRVRLLPARYAGAAMNPLLLALPTVALWLTDSWAVWAVGGLENPLGALLVVASFHFYFRSLLEQDGIRPAAAAGLLATLAALTHPSYAVFGLVLGVHTLATLVRSRNWRAPLAVALPALLLGTPYLAWKLAYYGHVLPNTFRAKVGITPAGLVRGANYLIDAGIGLPVVGIVAIAAVIGLASRRDRDPRPWLLLCALALYAAYVVAIGGEAFPAFRLWIVLLPLACLLLQYTIASVSPVGRSGASAALGIAVVLAMSAVNAKCRHVRVLDRAIADDALGRFRAAGLELKRRLPADALVADSGAGVIAFYSELPFLDTLGLTDEHIASRAVRTMGAGVPGHEKGDGRYVFSRRPHVILFGGSPLSSFTPVLIGDFELLEIPEFNEHYERRVISVPFTPRGTSKEISIPLPIFIRRDLLSG
jgi:hypothetical protein